MNNAVNCRKGLMKQPDANKALLLLVQLHMFLGISLGDLGDDSSHMPPSSGLPVF